MKKMWTMSNGEEIEISKMDNRHLINSIKMVQRFAKDGMVIQSGSCGSDLGDMWYDEFTIKGKEVYEHFGKSYKWLLEEANNRNITPPQWR